MVQEVVQILLKTNTEQAQASLTKFGSAAKLALNVQAGMFIKEGIKQASDLNEATSLLQRTTGKTSGGVKRLITDFKGLGLSQAESAEGLAKYITMYKNMGMSTHQSIKMAQELMKRGIDVGSAMNKTNEEMAPKLSAVLTGETEPLKELGVIMTQQNLDTFTKLKYHKDTFKQLSQTEQVQARLAYFMEKTKTSAGDFKATASGSLPNSIKQMQEDLKNMSGDIMKQLLPSLVSIVRTLRDNIWVIKAIGVAFATWKIGQLVSGTMQMVNNFKQMRNNIPTGGPGGGPEIPTTGGKGGWKRKLAGGALAAGAAGVSAMASGSGVGGAVGSAAGAWGGEALGAAIGSFILPGIGTVIGGMLGGAAGGYLGNKAGTYIDGELVSKNTGKHSSRTSGNITYYA